MYFHSIAASIFRRIPKFWGLERVVAKIWPVSSFSEEKSYAIRLQNVFVRIWPSSHIGWQLYFFGDYEPSTRRIMCQYIVDGSVSVEIGTNIGWHTLLMSKLAGEKGQVIAFEPSPEIFKKYVVI